MLDSSTKSLGPKLLVLTYTNSKRCVKRTDKETCWLVKIYLSKTNSCSIINGDSSKEIKNDSHCQIHSIYRCISSQIRLELIDLESASGSTTTVLARAVAVTRNIYLRKLGHCNYRDGCIKCNTRANLK